MSPGNSYPHLALTLQPVPLWNHLTVYQQYVIPATNAHTHTHIVYVTHILCIFSLTHTTHKNAITEACPPNPYTLIPIAESALCIHWLAGQLLKRERESKTGGRGKMETARHRNIRKRSRQIEKKEKLILGGTLETDPNWWEDRLSRAGRRVQK